MNKRIMGVLLVALMCLGVVAPAMALEPPTSFVLSGWVFDANGEPCSGPSIELTNTNTGESWRAETYTESNYYRLVINSTNVNAKHRLHLNTTCGSGSSSNISNRTLTQSEISAGGLFDFNITLEGEVQVQPDLVVSGIEVHVLNNSVNATIENIGMANITQQFNVSFSVNETTIGNKTIPHLDACNNTTVAFEWLLPQAGEYELCINADTGDEIIELNESNNEYRTNVTIPEIRVIVAIKDVNETMHIKELFLPQNAESKALNITEKACDALNILFNYDGENVTIDGLVNPAVFLYNRTSDNWSSVPRNRYLDDGDIIGWSDTGEFTTIQPDLIPSDIMVTSFGSVLYSNSTNTIKAAIENIGILGVSNFTCVLKADNETVDEEEIERLNAMNNITVSFVWAPDRTGDYALAVEVDSEDNVSESNEANNIITKNVTVELPPAVVYVSSIEELQDMIDVSPVAVANHGWMTIYLDEGTYIEYEDTGHVREGNLISIKDKRNITIEGEGMVKVGVIYTVQGYSKYKRELIRIVNSSNIELRGFSVEASTENELGAAPLNVQNIVIKNSAHITIKNLELYHEGYPTDDDNILIEIDNSENCTICENILSCREKGIEILNSRGNLLSNNTIYHNNPGWASFDPYSVWLNSNSVNNTIYFNNLFGPAKDYGSCNRWNSTTLSNYSYNGTTRKNYTGNHWNDYSGIDNNSDGIWDVPYGIGGDAGAFDYYPLREPQGLSFDMIVKAIVRPSIIYANRNNAILASVERMGTYPLPVQMRANLTVNDETYSRTITMNNGEHKVVRFKWNPQNIGNYHLEISVGADNVIEAVNEENIENNNLSIDVVVSSPPYVDNYLDNITSALDFLNESQHPLGSGSMILGFSTSAWAALAITAAGDDPTGGRWKPYDYSLIDYLRTEPKNSVAGIPQGSNPSVLNDVEDFARMILVISAVGEDPTDFGDVNYLTMLKSYYDGEQFGDADSVEDDALAILALVSCGEGDSEMVQSGTIYIKNQSIEGGWNDVKTTSLVIQALTAAGENMDSHVIKDALNYLENAQEDDGGFSDVETTSYAIQAIVAARDNPLDYTKNGANPMNYLLSLQQEDGSFKYKTTISLYPPRTTSFAIPALCAIPNPVMIEEMREDYELPDISVGNIKLEEDDICVNTSYTVTADVRSNGGIFDVDLYSNETCIQSKNVNSVWHDSLSRVEFTWKPNCTGIHNLTVVADSSNRIEELHEDNNNATGEVNVVLPDLYPSEIITPAEVYVNATNVINVVIKGTTDESFNVTLDADGARIGEKRIERIRKEITISFEWRPSENRTYTLNVTADAGGEAHERDENNNTLTRPVDVVLPDLVAVIPDEIDEIYVNATNEITVTVKGTAECFNISLIENGTVVGKTTNITCYEKKNVSMIWKPRSIGNHNITAFVDSDDDINETEEGNNNFTVTFEVLLPDLVPEEITPGVLYIDEVNTISVKVNGTAEGFNATLVVNDTLNETLIDKKTNANTYNDSIEFEWRATELGDYTLSVFLDSDDDVVETNETNNNLTISVIVAKRIKLRLLSPLGAEVWSGIHNITWNATYEKPFAIDLLYSPNKGESWFSIAVNVSNGVYEWDTRTVNDGEYMVKVVARCGKITSEDQSGIFIIQNGVTGSGGIGGNARYFFSDAPDKAYLVWPPPEVEIFAEPASSVVVGDGKVFVYCTGEGGNFPAGAYTYLVALDEWTGEFLWATKRLDPVVGSSWSSPAYHHGRVFAASGRYVYCLDSDDGHEIWRYKFADGCENVNGGPCIAHGNVYVGSYPYAPAPGDDTGHVYCLDEKNGSEKWAFNVQTCMLTNPTAAYGRIYFGDFPRGTAAPFYDGKPRIYCVDAITGKQVWNVTVAVHVGGSVVAMYGVVYAATYETGPGGGSFYALDADNGSELWEQGIYRSDSTPACYSPKGSSSRYVYVCGGCPGVSNIATYCFNTKDGEEKWRKPNLGGWTNSPAVSWDGKVFVGANATDSGFKYSGLYCLDALTGDVKWNSAVGGSSPYIADGMVFTIGGDGVVYAFGSKNGTVDLLVEPIAPIKTEAGENVSINVTIKNNGTANMDKEFSVKLWPPGSKRKEGTEIDNETITRLEIGGTENITFAWTPELAGDYHLVVEVNPQGKGHVSESNLTNNNEPVDITVTGLPDLVIDDEINDKFGKIPKKARVGDTVAIEVIITNNGSASTDEGFNVSLSIDGTHDNTSIPPASIPELEPFGVYNRTETAPFQWTPDAPGNYTLTFIADCDNRINESSESNNIMQVEIEVREEEEEEEEDEDDSIGFGPGSRGGHGGGEEGGIGAGSGTGEAGSGEAGGMQIPVNESGYASEKKKEVSGYPFGNATSGASGGGGTLPIMLVLLAIQVIALFYFGYYKEKRSHAKQVSPRAYRRNRNRK